MRTFDELQAGLASAMAANRPASGIPHTVIALGSHSLGESLISHYGDRVMALEHRFLLSGLMTHRLPDAHLLYISSVAPADVVLHYYRGLGPAPERFGARTQLVNIDDTGHRAMSAKLLDRPDLIRHVREQIAGRVALLEPWNVTELEVAVAEALQVPVNGIDPGLRHLGFKSAGRRLFRRAGVPVPVGVEDVRTVDEVVAAVARIRQQRPAARGVVVKHDDSGAGDGNVVVELRTPAGVEISDVELRRRLHALPEWYLRDLRAGGVVEELLTGTSFTSPSAQIEMLPDGQVDVLATHEQVVGGDNGQVFLGCRFPGDAAYAARLADHAHAIGLLLAAAGLRGRASVDFGAVREADGRWSVYALEANLRKGGTTHPYAALRNLVPGRYDPTAGMWVAAVDGEARYYVCTDNLVEPSFLGLEPHCLISAVRGAGLEFDHRTGVGVVLHMLSGLGIDGRFGLTAIATDPAVAQELLDRTYSVAVEAGRLADKTPDAATGL